LKKAMCKDDAIPQPEVPFCWAACLGDCSADYSSEHIVTESTMTGPQISIEGFPFQRGQIITIHKSDFSSNILCRYHNNKLSAVDQAGAAAFEAFKNAAAGGRFPKKYGIRGERFERWLLKRSDNAVSFRPAVSSLLETKKTLSFQRTALLSCGFMILQKTMPCQPESSPSAAFAFFLL
jgi:hypothetical protein